VPEEMRSRLDFETGKDRGRIYRIVAQSHQERSRKMPGLRADDALSALAHGLESGEVWMRECAFRLILERGDRSAGPLLSRVASGSPRAESRVLALRALHNLILPDEALLVSA